MHMPAGMTDLVYRGSTSPSVIKRDKNSYRRRPCYLAQRTSRDPYPGTPGRKVVKPRNGQQVLIQADTREWDLLIWHITMPGGLDVLSQLVRMKPGLPVLVLSMHPEDEYGKRTLKAGASGYLTKESGPEELTKAIYKVIAGGRYMSAALAERLALTLGEDAKRAAHEALSSREFEILRMIALGKTVGQVAQELHLSISTVSTYRVRILEKLNLATSADLIRYALHNRLVD